MLGCSETRQAVDEPTTVLDESWCHASCSTWPGRRKCLLSSAERLTQLPRASCISARAYTAGSTSSSHLPCPQAVAVSTGTGGADNEARMPESKGRC